MCLIPSSGLAPPPCPELMVRKLGAKVCNALNTAQEEGNGEDGKMEDEGGRVSLRQNARNCT